MLGIAGKTIFGIARKLFDETAGASGVAAQTTESWGRRFFFPGSGHSIIYPLGLPRVNDFWNRRITIDRMELLEHRPGVRWTSSLCRAAGTSLLGPLDIIILIALGLLEHFFWRRWTPSSGLLARTSVTRVCIPLWLELFASEYVAPHICFLWEGGRTGVRLLVCAIFIL